MWCFKLEKGYVSMAWRSKYRNIRSNRQNTLPDGADRNRYLSLAVENRMLVLLKVGLPPTKNAASSSASVPNGRHSEHFSSCMPGVVGICKKPYPSTSSLPISSNFHTWNSNRGQPCRNDVYLVILDQQCASKARK